MPMTPPRWYEVLIGSVLMAVTLAASWVFLHSEGEVPAYAWIGVFVVFFLGTYMVTPLRAQVVWEELRDFIGRPSDRPRP
jgi:antibiotic biosynthesis monooxygenase (ABM) superfamily enzyme